MNGESLEERLTQNMAGMLAVAVVKLEAASQFGVRLRVSAGARSFRREDKLKGTQKEAAAQLPELVRL